MRTDAPFRFGSVAIEVPWGHSPCQRDPASLLVAVTGRTGAIHTRLGRMQLEATTTEQGQHDLEHSPKNRRLLELIGHGNTCTWVHRVNGCCASPADAGWGHCHQPCD